MRTSTVGVLALLILAQVGFASDIYVDDFQAIYDYTPGGSRTTFSTQPGSGVLEMAFDASGNLFAAARDSNAIYEYSPGGVQTTFASVSSPYGLAIDPTGNIYSGINFGGTLERYTAGVGTPVGTGLNIYSLTTDANGNVFDHDGTGNIYEFAPNGTRTTYATATPSGFGIAIDGQGRIYVADWTNFTIDRYTPGTGWSTFGSLPTNQLGTSLAFNSSGTLFVTEVANGSSSCCVQSVYTFDSAGARSTFASGLYLPYGLAIQQSPVATPEPGTLGLAAVGGLLVLMRRRKK